jgi:hypothetical protein
MSDIKLYCAMRAAAAAAVTRFGSFEVCQPTDPQTGRSGPSAGMSGQLLLPLVGYVIKHHHPDLWAFYGGGDDVSMKGMAGSQVGVTGGGMCVCGGGGGGRKNRH